MISAKAENVYNIKDAKVLTNLTIPSSVKYINEKSFVLSSMVEKINIKDNIDVFIIVRSKVLDIDFKEMNKQILYLLRKQKTI